MQPDQQAGKEPQHRNQAAKTPTHDAKPRAGSNRTQATTNKHPTRQGLTTPSAVPYCLDNMAKKGQYGFHLIRTSPTKALQQGTSGRGRSNQGAVGTLPTEMSPTAKLITPQATVRKPIRTATVEPRRGHHSSQHDSATSRICHQRTHRTP